MRLKDKEMKDTTDEITLDDVIKILEIKNRLLVLSIS
jgi:hypothetical protein